jgi:predicted transcriptional regulator
MADRPDPLEKLLGPLEAEVTRRVWQTRTPVTVRDVVERLNESRAEPLAYTTVMTVMSRLVTKGVLSRRRAGRGYVYEPLVEDAAGIAVRNVMRDFGDAAVAHFVDEARDNPELMQRLERLLDDRREA